jgi:hypothetical protein
MPRVVGRAAGIGKSAAVGTAAAVGTVAAVTLPIDRIRFLRHLTAPRDKFP